MTIDCTKEIRNCISKYREELGTNKEAIKQIFKDPDGKININDYFYKSGKVCHEGILGEGKECQNTKLSNYTYDEWKQKTEKSHANDLVKSLGEEIKEPTIQQNITRKVLNNFKDYIKSHAEEHQKDYEHYKSVVNTV